MTQESIVNNPQAFVNNFGESINQLLQQSGGKAGKKERKKGKIGMEELQNIVVNLYRDVKRVKKAITPQGAQAMVDKHNEKSKPSAHWKLHTDDINNDGVPDIIIRNQKGDPLFVNGYTTVQSDLPFQQAYSQYLLDNPDKNSTEKYRMHEPKRLTAYQRFQRFILKGIFDNLMQGRGITGVNKLQMFAKLSGKLWNDFVIIPAVRAAQPNATSEDIEKARKSTQWKPIFDQLVTEYIARLRTDQNTFNEFADYIDQAISALVDADFFT